MADLAEHEPGHRVEVLLLEVAAELLVEVVDRERAVDPDPLLVDPLDRLVGQVELVLDLAHDLLEQVLERDDPRIAPYSSTTTAMCWLALRNSARSAPRFFVSGTMYGRPEDPLDVDLGERRGR